MSSYKLYISPALYNAIYDRHEYQDEIENISTNSIEIGDVNEFSMGRGLAIVSCCEMHESLIKTVHEFEYVTVSLSGKINFNAKVEQIEIVSRSIFIGNVENPTGVFLSFDCIFHLSEVVFK